MVSRRSAPRPVALAECREWSAGNALDSTTSAEGEGPCVLSFNGSALPEYGHQPGHGLRHQGADPAGKGLLIRASLGRSQVFGCRADSSSDQWRHFRYCPSGSLVPCLIPAYGHQPTFTCSPSYLPPAAIRCRTSLLGQRSSEAPNDPLLLWLAVSKMLHRSLGRQGYGQPLSALAGLSSTPCSLTASGPARGSPRPCGHP
jgi:hypothetical protein